MSNDSYDSIKIQEWRGRLKFLCDIVFATAMTIMILNINIPDFGHITSTGALTKFLINELNNMLGFFISFIVIAVYWLKHLEHFSCVKIVDQNFIWLQLLFLSFIMLIPFWNTYMDRFPDNIAIKVLLSFNMVLIGLFSFLSLNYASNPTHQLIPDAISKELLSNTHLQILTEPLIAILAAGLVYLNPILWDISFILVPVLFMLRKKLVKIKYFKKN